MALAVALVEVRLHGHEEEGDGDADAEVEVGKAGANVGEAVVDGEDVEDAVEVEEEEAVGPAVVEPEEDDDRFGRHDS